MSDSNGKVRSSYTATGFHMFQSIEVTNFRGIRSARLLDTKRINLIVGPNGTGKTALLESLFLVSGNSPENLIKTRQWRGREAGEIQMDPRHIDSFLWEHTFRNPESGYAKITTTGSDKENRTVEIKRKAPRAIYSATGMSEVEDTGLEFVWHTPDGQEIVRPEVTSKGVAMQMVSAGPGVHFFPARTNISERETAATFSRLSVEGQETAFTDVFRNEFNWLTDIAVEAPANLPALYARMPSGRKLPLTMISGGISHLAGMLLRLAGNPRCTLLIDEIENGFYHERYGSIWRTLYEMSVKNDCQVFATTHSLECLRALVAALPDHAQDVSFIRSRLDEGGEVEFEQLSGGTFFGAAQTGEVR